MQDSIPHLSTVSRLSPARSEKPLVLRLMISTLLAISFFSLGYGVYYVGKLQHFLATSMSQKVQVTTTKSTFVGKLPDQNATNILLLGSDNDQKFTGNPLTQTMMIVHINFDTKEVDMFSIPRDLWVKMPGQDTYGKIDQAAEYTGVPSAIQVVEETFGIPIDHYAWVGLYGFIKSIDAVGGVNLDILHPVLDNAYPTDINNPNPYGYQRLDIQAGMQHLSGEEALQYVRSRHEDLLGDFGRTQRQRQLLLALKGTVLHSQSSLLNLPDLFDSLQGQIKTDITPSYALSLAYFYLTNKSVPENQYTLAPGTYTSIGNSTDGQSIVIGDATESAKLVTKLFGQEAGQTTYTSLVNVEGVAK